MNIPFSSFAVSFVILLIAGGNLTCRAADDRQPPYSGLPPAPAGFRWELNPDLSDEFTGTTLDTAKWLDHFPGWMGRPPAKFIPENILVTNGCLQIHDSRLSQPAGDYTIGGGAVVSKNHGFYGYYEVRMKASKVRMSSTFWLSNDRPKTGDTSSAQELDIVETIGGPPAKPDWASKVNQSMNSTLHCFYWLQKPEDLRAYNKAPLFPPSGDAFHVYGAWWVDADTVKFYLDSKYQGTQHPSTKYSGHPFDRPMHINMVTECYDWARPVPTAEELNDPAINTTYYNWVRAYKLVGNDPGTK